MLRYLISILFILVIDPFYDLVVFFTFKKVYPGKSVKIRKNAIMRKLYAKLFRINIADDGIYLVKLSERIRQNNF